MPDARTDDLLSIPPMDSPQSRPTIHWPAAFQPATADAYARNELLISAEAEVIWAWLVRAELWPTWYASSSAVRVLSHAGPDLDQHATFRWKTFGLRITCRVSEFKAPYRLAWQARGIGVTAWHAWLLTPVASGRTHVLTEEVQHGWMSRLGRMFTPGQMHRQHQLWLENLSRQARNCPPPNG